MKLLAKNFLGDLLQNIKNYFKKSNLTFRPNNKLNKWFFLIGFTVFLYQLNAQPSWKWWMVTSLMYILVVGLGISLTYHRYLNHRSFKMNRFWEIAFTAICGLTGSGSSFGWVTVHRTHHLYADTEKDPHSPLFSKKLDLILGNYNIDFNKWIAKDLLKDQFHMNFHHYYLLLMAIWVIFLYFLGFNFFAHIWAIPLFLNKLQSFLSVWLSHDFGYRNFETPDQSQQNWLISLLIFGEGWHNNHHYRPNHWNFSHKWWELDLGGLFVRVFRSKT